MLRLIRVCVLFFCLALIQFNTQVAIAENSLKPVVYSLTINDDNGKAVDLLQVREGEEAIDTASEFAVVHKLQRKQLNQIVNHLCSLGDPIKCTRRRARHFLFELYIEDSNLADPLVIKVFDVHNFRTVALRSCSQLPSCKAHQDIIDSQWKDPDSDPPLSLLATNILNELQSTFRNLQSSRLASSDCYYRRLGLETPREATSNLRGYDDGEENNFMSLLKTAFKSLSKVFHPDKPGGDLDLFIRLQEAYSVLSDVNAKQQYDLKHGHVDRPRTNQPHFHGWMGWNVAFNGADVVITFG